jgi:molybdopterin-guanine dinucleotide biosynthesis protein MobB
MAIPVITIIGKSGSGKTTLMVKLIAGLKQRGYRIGTIKHHSHTGFEIDCPGKDSWRHAQAGSQHVVIAAPGKIASYRLLDVEPPLDEILASIDSVDIILVEGYKQAGKPTLEVVRSKSSPFGADIEAAGKSDYCFAVAADFPLRVNVPVFDLDDAEGMLHLIEELFLASDA